MPTEPLPRDYILNELRSSTLAKMAAELLSEDRENPEYDRGVIELVACAIGVPMDQKDIVHQVLLHIKRACESSFAGIRCVRDRGHEGDHRGHWA